MQNFSLPGEPVIAAKLEKTFGRRVLWRGLTFRIEPGRMISLTGPSGSGKSTLLNCIGLLERPSAGTLSCGSSELTAMNSRQARLFRKRTLGYLFQDYALIDNATIEQNLDVALRSTANRSEWHALTRQALNRVGLKGREREPVFQLSGGEQQRVALARLIVKRPGIILADEPTGALDHGNADMVIATLRDMANHGGVIIIATHSDRVANACDATIELG